MLEFLICSLLTIFPDYMFRRYVQGKHLGKEINLFTVWFELRWGITACLLLTISLITLVFYFHPSSEHVVKAFRTLTLQPQVSGRVEEVYVTRLQHVEAGQPLFKMDDSRQRASLAVAERRVVEVQASLEVAQTEMVAIDGQIRQAQAAYDLARDDLATYQSLRDRNQGSTTRIELNRLQAINDARNGELQAAMSSKQTLQTRIDTLIPAELASAQAQVEEEQIALDHTIIRAGVSGYVQQFTVRPGEIINPMFRPAGILVPDDAGEGTLVAGFKQVEAQVLKVGMIAEVTCASKPYTIIPMVVTEVQNVIASGQVRGSDTLLDTQAVMAPGTITATLEPLYKGAIDDIPRGSSCIANAYTNNAERLESADIGFGEKAFLHVVDTTALVHALILRIQTVMIPLRTLVLG